MDASRRASGYDLFKLIVAILLLILFFLLLNRPTSQSFASESTPLPPTGTISSNSPATSSAVPAAIPVASTLPGPTSTSLPFSSTTETIESSPTNSIQSPTAINVNTATATPLSSPTATHDDLPSPTSLPSPTAATTIEATSTPLVQSPVTMTACESASSRSRLQTGRNATLLRRLNFRSSPGIQNNWLRTNSPGTQVEVIGGPECVPYVTGAYIWWQVRLPDGEVGWSAEGSIHGTFYFMKPE